MKLLSLKKGVFSVLFTNIFILVVALVNSILISRNLGPFDKGLLTLALVYPDLLTTLSSFGIKQSTIFFIGKKEYSIEIIWRNVMSILYFSSFFGTALLAGMFFFYSNSDFPFLIVFLILISYPMRLFVQYGHGIFLSRQNVHRFNFSNIISPIITLFSVLLFLYYLNMGLEGAVFGYFFGHLINSYWTYKIIVKDENLSFSPHFDINVIKAIFAKGLKYGAALFLILLNQKLAVLMLERYSNASEIGIYSIGENLVYLIWQIPNAVGVIIFSKSANVLKNKEREFSLSVIKLLSITFIVAIFGSLLLLALSGFLIPLAYGIEFEGSVTVLNLLLFGVVSMTIFKILNMDLAGKGKPMISFWVMVPSVILNLILSWFLIPKFGANGAAISTSLSYTFCSMVFLFIYFKHVEIPVSQLFKLKIRDLKF